MLSKEDAVYRKWSKFKQSLPTFSLGTAIFLTCYTVLFFELFLQLFSPVVLTPRYVVDGGYGVRGNWPGAKYSHYSREFGRIEFSINQQGARSDNDFSLDKPSGVFRIVAFGDSFTAGFGARFEETYLEQMKDRLIDLTSRDVEVINFGVSGHGTAEELVALQALGLRFEPDVVLFQWHHTDLQDNIRSQLFGVDESGLRRLNDSYLPAVGIRERLFRNSLYRFVAEHSMSYTWVRNKAAQVTKRSLFRARSERVNVQSDNNSERPHERRKSGTLGQQELAIALLKEARRVSELSGAEFQVLDVPYRPERGIFESTFPKNSGLEEFIYSPISEFDSHSGEVLYWERSAGHFSRLGNKIVGQGLATAIARSLNTFE